MKTSQQTEPISNDIVRKERIISGRAAIREATEAGERTVYKVYDLLIQATSPDDGLTTPEICMILFGQVTDKIKRRVYRILLRARKWFLNETLVPYSVLTTIRHKGADLRAWVTYNITSKAEYIDNIIPRKARMIAGAKDLDKINLKRSGQSKKERLKADARMKRRRQSKQGAYY